MFLKHGVSKDSAKDDELCAKIINKSKARDLAAIVRHMTRTQSMHACTGTHIPPCIPTCSPACQLEYMDRWRDRRTDRWVHACMHAQMRASRMHACMHARGHSHAHTHRIPSRPVPSRRIASHRFAFTSSSARARIHACACALYARIHASTHRIASHCMTLHGMAWHRIASHRIASHRITFRDLVCLHVHARTHIQKRTQPCGTHSPLGTRLKVGNQSPSRGQGGSADAAARGVRNAAAMREARLYLQLGAGRAGAPTQCSD